MPIRWDGNRLVSIPIEDYTEKDIIADSSFVSQYLPQPWRADVHSSRKFSQETIVDLRITKTSSHLSKIIQKELKTNHSNLGFQLDLNRTFALIVNMVPAIPANSEFIILDNIVHCNTPSKWSSFRPETKELICVTTKFQVKQWVPYITNLSLLSSLLRANNKSKFLSNDKIIDNTYMLCSAVGAREENKRVETAIILFNKNIDQLLVSANTDMTFRSPEIII